MPLGVLFISNQPNKRIDGWEGRQTIIKNVVMYMLELTKLVHLELKKNPKIMKNEIFAGM